MNHDSYGPSLGILPFILLLLLLLLLLTHKNKADVGQLFELPDRPEHKASPNTRWQTRSLALGYLKKELREFRKVSHCELDKDIYEYETGTNNEAFTGILSEKEQRYSMPY
jgi:hypothetical protein